MSGSVERRLDGSFALLIDGDLQFDSRDEHIYHEGLVLPALSASCQRAKEDLRVLIVGGGDGLSCREVFKSNQIAKVDLVDYDAAILAMAKTEFAAINHSSLSDDRLSIHVQDAWKFACDAVERGARYDLIVSDLTVAEDVDGARFHTVDWYEKLFALLSDQGVLAVNGVSPQATPWAFWSIFNSMSLAGLHARPYRVEIPSFTARGYGADWGFFVAAKAPISSEDEFTAMVEGRRYLTDRDTVIKMFDLPQRLFDLQTESSPALSGSDILLQYFSRGRMQEDFGPCRSSLKFDTMSLSIPLADTGRKILPVDLSLALAKVLEERTADSKDAINPDQVLEDLLLQVPSLQRSHTPELIQDFLSEPAAFLQSIDMLGLVNRVLEHTSSLPAKFVNELKLLAKALEDWRGDQSSLMQTGTNFVMLLTLVLVVGNLLYPDMVYAKGDHHGRGGYGGYWGGGGTDIIDRRRPRRDVETIVEPAKRKPSLEIRDYGKGALPENPSRDGQTASRQLDATFEMLDADRREAIRYQATLARELHEYVSAKQAEVTYGMHIVPREEAIRLTRQSLSKVATQLASLETQIAELTPQIHGSTDGGAEEMDS